MPYTLLAGEFVIRYPDLPRGGPQPDGDTIKFAPDTPALVDDLPRPSGGAPDINQRGISVRLEAIDALETHFEGAHQELEGANAARDELLRALGFTNVTFFPDLPNTVQSADQDRVRGHVLSNGIDANGRLIGFVEPGDATEPDGAQVFLDDIRAGRTVNAALLEAGLVYPALYSTLPASLRSAFAQTSRAARAAGAGLWPRSTADPDGPAQIADKDALETLVLWPKLFRRLIPYLETETGFDGFDTWLQADPVNRDDEIVVDGRTEPERLHDVVDAAADHVQLTAWPEDFVITPDPPAAR
jgi:endonuclease YncB( thermonuclease family)